MKLVAALIFLAVACRTTSGDSSLKIVGGKPVKEGHPGFQSVVGFSLGEDLGTINCSGTLVAPNVILTAAHCLASEFTHLAFVQGEGGAPPVFRKIGQKGIHPAAISFAGVWPEGDRGEYGPLFDVAWVKFSGSLPPGFAPASLLESAAELTAGVNLELVGFGQTSLEESGGEKLSASVPLHKLQDDGVFRAFLLVGPDSEKRGTCFGDSGGAAFLKVGNEWKLAGIIEGSAKSYEFLWDIPVKGKTCDDGMEVLGSVPHIRHWLAKTAGAPAAAGPVPKTAEWVRTMEPRAKFTDYCESENLTLKSWQTVAALSWWAQSKDCEKVSANHFDSVLRLAPDVDWDVLASLPKFEGVSLSREDFGNSEVPWEKVTPFVKRSTTLHVQDSSIKIKQVAAFPHLTSLRLSISDSPAVQPGDAIGPLDYLAEFLQLQSLEVRARLKTIEPITSAPSTLTKLTISNTRLETIEGIQKYSQIRSLDISGNKKLTSIAPLVGLTSLNTLSLQLTSVTDVKALSALPIEELDVSNIAQFDIAVFGEGFSSLKRLKLNNIGLVDIQPLLRLPLEELEINRNGVTSLAPLAEMTTLKRLQSLGNPLSDTACPIPEDRGICKIE